MTFKARNGIDVNAGKFHVNKDGDVDARQVNQIVNVKAFGAVGDSVTNDSDAIARAAEFCMTNGGLLYFPRGDYYFPDYSIPEPIGQLYETGGLIQSNRAYLQFGNKKPNNPKEGTAYWDKANDELMVFDGTQWVSFITSSGSNVVDGDLTIEGDLIVKGSTTVVTTDDLHVADSFIKVNSNVTGLPTVNGGIEVERGDLNNAKLYFDESEDLWKMDNGTGTPASIMSGNSTDFTSLMATKKEVDDAKGASTLKARFDNLEKAQNEQKWVSTEGQDTFTLSNGSYTMGTKSLKVFVQGAIQVPVDGFTEVSTTSFKLTEQLPAGIDVYATWLEGKLPVAFGHKSSHEAGGQDELDLTKLKNYDSLIGNKFKSVENRLGWVSVKDYGAKGDNATDDTAAIQAAVDAVMKSGGGTVYFPPGNYIIGGTIFTQRDSYSANDVLSPLELRGVTPVFADLFNTTRNVSRLIKKNTGSMITTNYTESGATPVGGVWRNFTVRNFAFAGLGTYDTKYTGIFASVYDTDAIVMRNTSINLEDCYFSTLKRAVYQPDFVNGSDNYCDQSMYKRLSFRNMGDGWLYLMRPDATTFLNLNGYDMAKTATYGVYVKKGESFAIRDILCAGKGMHLCTGFKMVDLYGVKGVTVDKLYAERVEGLLVNVDGEAKNITVDGIDVRQYGKTMIKARNTSGLKIDNLYQHIEEKKVLSASDTGDFSVYSTLGSLPLDIDVDSSCSNIEIGENTTFRGGIHVGGSGNLPESGSDTFRYIPNMNPGFIYKLNVRRFGARGNGITDDTAAIQKAIDTAKLHGAEVYFPRGTYIVTSLAIDYSTDTVDTTTYGFRAFKLRGDSKRQTIIRQTATTGNSIIKVIGQAYNRSHSGKVTGLIIEGLEIVGNDNGGSGIYLRSFNDLTLRDLHIRACGGDGIKLDRQTFINQPDASGGKDEYAYGLKIENSKIFLNKGWGINSVALYAIGSAIFDNLDIHGNTLGGVNINPTNVTFIGGNIIGNGGNGLKVIQNPGYPASVTFSLNMYGTRFEGNSGYEIKLDGSMAPLLSGVTILATAGAHCIGVGLATGTGNEVRQPNIIGGYYAGDKVTAGQKFLDIGANSFALVVNNPRVDIVEFLDGSTGNVLNLINDLGNDTSIITYGRTERTEKIYLRGLYTDRALQTKVYGDVNSRLIVRADGYLSWGDGTSAPDTKLYRYQAGKLKTDGEFHANVISPQGTDAKIYSGTGDPNGVITAASGSLFLRTDGGAGTSFYIKESDTGSSNWVAK